MMNIVNIQNFTYTHPDKEPLFDNLNLQIDEGQKVALVGRNGVGKTTLFEAIKHYSNYPAIKVNMQPYGIPQHTELYDEQSIAQVLGIDAKIKAMEAIVTGSTNQEDYDSLADDWDIENRASLVLSHWELDVNLHTLMSELSGGEKVKVFLAGITLHQPRFILLDEPTNHLDYNAREKLYSWLQETSATIFTISHDRYLLNLLTDIYELSDSGIRYYSGNYDSYLEQKELEQNALLKQLDSQKQELKKTKKVQQEVAERRQRLESRGGAQTAKKSLPRIIANARKGSAENTTADLNSKHEKKISELNKNIHSLQEGIDTTRKLRVKIDDSVLHRGKILVEAIDINYAYSGSGENIWKEDLSFTIRSGERVLIKGQNGSGKTTLIKLITRKIEPTKGELKLADFDFLYLDQDYSLIDPMKTVYQQAQSYNINMPESDVKRFLTHAQFLSDSWVKPCGALSGGERMKLSLCSLIIANKSPDMLILDEPTNNLDLDSMSILSRTVGEYKGSLIVVSHDRYFVEELNLSQEISLNL